ncbi:hypothetical protein [Deinococcus arcticus]|uniref:Uncharacterized protein n=1 Tax=Deinococcus arcticus TaxID=2136176 RepID=A0A2T3W539_9DEIO|nr:hypothetical protein [Deinococcus arcticus]PTA67010.1 hypothetical protein C8263_14965 [Deinococcus arcticus]
MRAHQLALLLTGALLLGLLGLGLRLQLGRGGGRARWPHHALFFAVCLGTGLGGLLAQRAGQPGAALLPALALLLTMPATRPGQGNHWRRALACAAAFGLGAALTWA